MPPSKEHQKVFPSVLLEKLNAILVEAVGDFIGSMESIAVSGATGTGVGVGVAVATGVGLGLGIGVGVGLTPGEGLTLGDGFGVGDG